VERVVLNALVNALRLCRRSFAPSAAVHPAIAFGEVDLPLALLADVERSPALSKLSWLASLAHEKRAVSSRACSTDHPQTL